MSTELIINASLPETRIALMENGEIQDLLIERASGKGIVGNIYKGRVTRVLPGMQAAFVDIGLEKAAFLYVDDVYVHSEVWEEDADGVEISDVSPGNDTSSSGSHEGVEIIPVQTVDQETDSESQSESPSENFAENLEGSEGQSVEAQSNTDSSPLSEHETSEFFEESEVIADDHEEDEEDSEDEESGEPVEMGRDPKGSDEDDNIGNRFQEQPQDTVKPDQDQTDVDDNIGNRATLYSEGQRIPLDESVDLEAEASEGASLEEGRSEESTEVASQKGDQESRGPSRTKKYRRGTTSRRPTRFGKRRNAAATIIPVSKDGNQEESAVENEASGSASQEVEQFEASVSANSSQEHFESSVEQIESLPSDLQGEGLQEGQELPLSSSAQETHLNSEEGVIQAEGESESEVREAVSKASGEDSQEETSRKVEVISPVIIPVKPAENRKSVGGRPEFKMQRSADRRIPSRQSTKSFRNQVNIQDLLKEGQEVLVQVAKDPISTKGARLTCHISLPGRHLVCMPTIDHVGVSRRIEREDERRRLRDFVERNRPKNLGFIVRTASGRQQSERRIKQDIEYLSRLWDEIREKAASVSAPALVYEDLNSVLRAIRDWVTEDIDKVIVDSRYHYNEIQRFVSHFMPSLKQKVELYHGDIPIFDAYNISTELSRALERKVWLKSGGYLVIDQAEALVAIDVNTGRYVGKKNLEDTILKTNLEAVQEIAYQLRLRNCGGIIILDLIDMEKEENRQRVYRALEDALKRDRARPSILKISELGLIEMTRKRTRDTMVRTLCESCSHCEGKGYIKSKQTVAYEVLREVEREGIEKEIGKVLVQANSEVIDILAIDERETLDQLERRYRKQVYLQAVTEFHPEQFEVVGDKKTKAELSKDQGSSQNQRQRDYSGDRSRSSHHDNGEKIISHRNQGEKDREKTGDRDRGGDRERSGRRRDHRGGRSFQRYPQGNYSIGNRTPVAPIQIQGEGAHSLSTQEIDGQRVEVREGESLDQVRENPRVITPVANQNFGANPEGGATSYTSQENASEINPNSQMTSEGDDDFFDEEDRLAFLRAQAAQDAALARLGLASGNSTETLKPRANGAGERSAGGRGGHNNHRRGRRNNRRGGKFRQDRGRRHHPLPGSGAGTITPVNTSTVSEEIRGDSNSDSSSDSGHSQPPV